MAEKIRLGNQAIKILNRLQKGPATNSELSRIALKYTSRISDLRQMGYVIRIHSRNHETGEVRYILG